MKVKNKYISKTPQSRLYQTEIPIIGLTGGIATGKSTVSNILAQAGHPIIDADKMVAEVYQMQNTIQFIKGNFPGAIVDEQISFPQLREIFFENTKAQKAIEEYIYALLPGVFEIMLESLGNIDYVIYDVPLLFEKKINERIDVTSCVYLAENIQKERLKMRDGNSDELIEKILNNQIKIEEKKKMADFIIDNTKDLEHLDEEVQRVVHLIFDNT